MTTDPKHQAAAGFLMNLNERAARDYMARQMCEDLGLFHYIVDHENGGPGIFIRLDPRGEQTFVEEPEPWNFPSEALRQRLLLLA